MLPKSHRLSTLSIRLKKPQTFNFKDFIIKKSGNGLDHLRVGVIISAKVGKTSVERHRIKRQIMESLKLNWNLNMPYDVVIITLPSISAFKNKEIQEKIAKIRDLG